MSEDPIGLAGGINNYAYAANYPVNMSDPTGLCYQGVYVTVLGTSEPCTSGWLGLSYLINRWNGIGDRDGRITSIMGGMVKGGGQDDGWRDDGPVRTPAEVSKSAATCWLNGAEGEVQIGAFAALGGNVGVVGAEVNVDALSATVNVSGTGNVKTTVTSGLYGTLTVPGLSIPWGVKNVHDGKGWSGWRWAGTPSVEVPIGGKIGLLGGGSAKYKLGDAFRCWVKA